MAGTRDIKRRIKSITSTRQITRAMKMVSAAKLRRSQAAVLASRPFTHRIEQLILHVSDSLQHPYLQQQRQVHKVAYVVIGFDQGMCGGFCGNLSRFLAHTLEQEQRPWELVAIGRQIRDFCRREGYPISEDNWELGDDPGYSQAQELGAVIRQRFDQGEYDEVHIIYSHFLSAMSQEQRCVQILPIPHPKEDTGHYQGEHIFEPSPEQVLAAMLPHYVDRVIFCLIKEAKASEHGARMTAMSAASDNAGEMLNKLTLSLNRARQDAITTEISEITGGAEALAQVGY